MRNRLLLAGLAAGGLSAAALPAAAQVDSIRACYIPTTGNVYRIGTPDTRPDCASPNHIRFAWPASFPDLGIGGNWLLRLRSGSPPGDRFLVDSAGGMAALGTLGIGDIPVTGAGYRMMWYPYKAAFRAGYDDGFRWSDSNIGFFSWAGGSTTIASGYGSFAFGDGSTASSVLGFAFGSNVNVSGTIGFSAGANNQCSGFGCVALGYTTTASGQGSVAIGYRVTADNDYTVTLGQRASSRGHYGTFVWADRSTISDSLTASDNNQFTARAAGGFRLFTSASLATGVTLSPGGSSWNVVSDRNRKQNFREVDGEEVLSRIRGIPVQTWNYIAEGRQVRHMGPMAQDWHAAWRFNGDDKTINSGDFDGVNFAAVKALEARTRELQARQAEVDRLNAEVATLRQRQAASDARLAELEAAVSRLSQRH